MGCVCANERADKELDDNKIQEISKFWIYDYIYSFIFIINFNL